MYDLSIFRYFDRSKFNNVKTFLVAPGFELNIKVPKPGGCETEFVLIFSHYPSLTYLAFTNKDSADLMMKLPGVTTIDDVINSTGDIFLSNMTVHYDLNDHRCLLTLIRDGNELKKFSLSLEEYKALKQFSYEVTMMYERFDETDCEECTW